MVSALACIIILPCILERATRVALLPDFVPKYIIDLKPMGCFILISVRQELPHITSQSAVVR